MTAPACAFRPAQRSEAKPLIGLYSESGCGKTWSALLLARGYVGPGGTIGMIETEGGRGEAYVGREPVGQYLVRPIRQVFSPQEYGKAITEAEDAKLGALIIDSASHEWEGAGGVLSMAAANDLAGKKGVLVWQQPKIDHQRHFMLRLMQTPIPLVIVCMRAKYPMEQKGANWTRSTVLEPKQSSDILFEMFVHGWIDTEHRFNGTKYSLPELAHAIVDKQPISIQSGQRLAQWAAGTSNISPPAGNPSTRAQGGAGGPSPGVSPGTQDEGWGEEGRPHLGAGDDPPHPALPLEEAREGQPEDSRLRYIKAARDHIRKATDYEALGKWWNSEEQKKARRDFELTDAEVEGLKTFVKARLDQLKPQAATS